MAAYLLGTFPTAATVGRRRGRDPASEGSGNPGATNVYRLAGARAGAVVLIGDLLKGMVASAAGLVLGGRGIAVAAGAAAVVGHCFPVWRRRGGGKGVATAAGMGMVLFPLAAAAAAIAWLAVAATTRKASLASLVALFVLPGIASLAAPAPHTAAIAGVSALVVARHHENIGRLVRGEEASLRTDRTAG